MVHILGKNNQFHVNSQSELAQRYNDISVLENHHCAITFAVLAKRDCAIMENISIQTQKEVLNVDHECGAHQGKFTIKYCSS